MTGRIGACIGFLLGLMIAVAPVAVASSDGQSEEGVTSYAQAGSRIEVPVQVRDARGNPLPNGLQAGRGGAQFLRAGGTAAPYITSIWPTSGPTSGGTVVDLAGGGFGTGGNLPIMPTVTFGGVVATVRTFNSIRITVTAPAHDAGTVDVTVRNADGSLATKTGGYSYGDGPAPSIVSISPPLGHCAGNDLVTIKGDNFRGPTIYFGDSAATIANFSSTSFDTCTVYTPPHAYGLVDVTVTNTDNTQCASPKAFTYSDIDLTGKWQRRWGQCRFQPANIGTAAAGSFKVTLYASPYPWFSSYNKLISTRIVATLEGGQRGSWISVSTIRIKRKYKYLIARVNEDTQVLEYDYANNDNVVARLN